MEPKFIVTGVQKHPTQDVYVIEYAIRFPRLDGNFGEVTGTAFINQPVPIINPSPEVGVPLEQ